MGFNYNGPGLPQWSDLPNKRQRQDDPGAYDPVRDPYRQMSSYDHRALYHDRQGAAYGDASHSRQSSQSQYAYTTPQGSDLSSYYQGQPYTPSQNRMGLIRTPEMMGNLTLDQATHSPSSGQLPSQRYNDPVSRFFQHSNFKDWC